MVNLILKYIKAPLTAYLPFVTKVDAPVYRISSGEVFSGVGSEKENVSISDNVGKGLYIRQIQQEQVKEKKKFNSCDKEYEITARCKAVFYSFSQDEFIINPDKISARIQGALKKVTFEQYTGSAKEITIDILSASTDFEKIFTEETGKQLEGSVWPTLVTVDFTLSYVDTNCNTCDIDDSETVVTWTPDLTPENCETKAICEVISKCDVITLLQEQTASLQEQIDNLPQSGLTCTDLPNCQTIIDILQSINDIVSGLPSSYFSCGDLAVCQTIIDIVSDISDLQTQVGTNTTDISTLQGQVSSLISDLGTLTTTVNNHISDTSNPHNVTLEQARSENSSISGDINANNNTIINLKDAVNPQEPITKIQFDTYVSAVGGNRGAIDCSTNPNYPASNQGDRWEVTVAGKIGGALGINVDVYDEIVCKTTSVSGNQATVGANFYIVQGNIERATETTSGYIQLATDVEVQAGTDNSKAVTSLKLQNWWVNIKTLAHTFAAKITFTTAPRFNSTTANQRLEVDSNNDLISVAKGTADNKNFGTTAGTVLEGDRISQTITNGVIDKAPSEDVVFDSLALKAPIASPTFTGTVTTPALNISGQTADTLTYLDASKRLVSVTLGAGLDFTSGTLSSTYTIPSLADVLAVSGSTGGYVINSIGGYSGLNLDDTFATMEYLDIPSGDTSTFYAYNNGIYMSLSTTLGDLGSVAIYPTSIDLKHDNIINFNTPQINVNGLLNISTGTANRVTYLDASKKLVTSTITNTVLNFLSGTTSNIQTQINNKQNALIGTGFVKSTAGVISYDINTYLTTATAASTYVPYTGATTDLDMGTHMASADTLRVTGLAGTGYLRLPNQSVTPSTPGTSIRIFADSTNRLSWIGLNGFTRTFDGTANTADRVYTLQDRNGIIADDTDLAARLRRDPLVTSISSSANPTVNSDTCDFVDITALATNITSMTTNLTGTPGNGRVLTYRIYAAAVQTIGWGAGFENLGGTLPSATVAGKVITVGLRYRTSSGKFGCLATTYEA